MARGLDAPFRFWGEVRMLAPDKYQGRKVDCFLISHERDLSALAGQTITIPTDEQTLYYQLDHIDPFSVADTHQLAAENVEGRFLKLDLAKYANPVEVTAHVVNYLPEEKAGTYFVFDMLLSGSMVTLKVDRPKKYRGTNMHILIQEPKNASAAWSKQGAAVSFSVPERCVAWEPWGFTLVGDLHGVSFN